MMIYRIGFLMFQSGGHITHDHHLRLEVAKDPEIEAEWLPISQWNRDRWQTLPVIKNNLTLLNGFRARDQLRRNPKTFDLLYCHTQEAAVLLEKYTKRIPTILSLDATPINLDSIGAAYRRKKARDAVRRVKHLLIKRSFDRAAHLVTFNHWAKNSLISDYGVSADKVTVNPPGLDLSHWNVSNEARAKRDKDLVPRVLFVGGDFRRKGGEALLQAAALMQGKWLVDIATYEPNIPGADQIPNLQIHRSLKTGTPELLALYGKANIFALPTTGDCSPWAILEAMAMQLPVISTPIGAIPELVIHGETGLLIPPNSTGALLEAVNELGRDPKRRQAMGIAGRRRMERYFDSAQNYRNLIDLIKSIAGADGRSGRAVS